MDGKRYCYTIGTDKYSANDLVGITALDYQNLASNNVKLPAGFVISGFAFDDFIVANGLVEDIVNRLEEVAQKPDKSGKISQKIQELIIKSELTAEIKTSIQEALQPFGNIEQLFVEVIPSALNTDLDNTFRGTGGLEQTVKGLEVIYTAVKTCWAQIFSEKAIDYRLVSGYEGNLSQAVIVQKVLNPEASGIVYNFELGTGSETVATIIANLGVSKAELIPPTPTIGQPASTSVIDNQQSDYYEMNKASQKLFKQLRNSQQFMAVRSRPGDNKQLTEVKISKVWTEKPKLDETQLKRITNLINVIDKQQSNKYSFTWVFESGQLTVTGFTSYSEEAANLLAPIGWKSKDIETETISLKPETEEMPTTTPAQTTTQDEPTLKLAAPDPNVGLPAVIPTTPKEEAIAYLQEHKDEITLSPEEREHKAATVREMLPEVKTVTEVWWNSLQDVSELKVFLNNIEGYGVFTFKDVITQLGASENIGRIKELKSLQKKVCEYLATYLTAIAPKPIFILIDKEIDIDLQVDLMAQLRNLYGHKNFWTILPAIKDISEISRYKKILASNGFRRTNTFHLFQMISQPMYLANLKEIIEQNIDGIIVDVDSLYNNLMGGIESHPEGENYELLLNFLIENLIEKSQTKLFTFLQTESKELLEKMLAEVLENGINGIIYNGDDLLDFKQKLTEKETNILTKSLKRIKKNLNLQRK